MFVDKVQVQLYAGDGGDGAVSFRHEKFIDKGGPDGGDGGNGADVILVASRNQNTLASFRYQKLVQAEFGANGQERKKRGKSGKDLLVPVPVGTIAYNDKGDMIADLTEDGQRQIVAYGGKGGFGNAHFVSSTRQAPRVAEKGEQGDKIEAVLELKLIADVGLVGLPNAGKSTLLSVISGAKPEIANYPFTTIRPNLGVVDITKGYSLLFADIPGLIEGASQGKGLGDEFLRHVERTKVLVHLIDAYTNDLVGAYKTIMDELKSYKVDLSVRPQIVVITKTEGMDNELIADRLAQLQPLVPAQTPLMAISAQAGTGIKELLFEVKNLAEQVSKVAEEEQAQTIPVIGLRPDSNSWKVIKREDHYEVTGRKIEKFAAKTRFGDFHSEQRLRDIMQKMGIMRELQKQDIQPEDQIKVGPYGSIEY